MPITPTLSSQARGEISRGVFANRLAAISPPFSTRAIRSGFCRIVTSAERIAGDDDQIGELALLDRADVMLPAETFGGPAGRRPQCLKRRQPGFDEALDLDSIARMAVPAGIGSGRDLDPGGEGPAQALDMVFLQAGAPVRGHAASGDLRWKS